MLDFSENISSNNFTSVDAEVNISGLLKRGGILDLHLMKTVSNLIRFKTL